jgi:vancomycin resistance protein YoaR
MAIRPSQIPDMSSLSRGSSSSDPRASAPGDPSAATVSGNGTQTEPTGATSAATKAEAKAATKAAEQRRRRWRPRTWQVLVAVPVVLALIAVAAWAVDTSRSSDHAMRNTVVGDIPVGGRDEAGVADAVDQLATIVEGSAVAIDSGTTQIIATAEQLGVEVDREATVDEVMDRGRTGGLLDRAQEWVGSFSGEHEVPLQVHASVADTEGALAELEEGRTNPVEPTVAWDGTAVAFVVTPGTPGLGIDARDVVDQLPGLMEDGGTEFTVEVAQQEIAPRFSEADAEQVAADAEQLTGQPLPVDVEGSTGEVPPDVLRSWISASAGDDALDIRIDAEKANTDIGEIVGQPGQPAQNASFSLYLGVPVIVPAVNGTGCCSSDSGTTILDALEAGTPANLQLAEVEPDFTDADAESWGITQEIGRPDEFGPTTPYSAGQSRVTNIQRMADIVRGYVIPPNGGEFDINDVVGERTRENGFVSAGAIENGVHVESVGGGVSQFATTTFNAAFFAGLDITSYQFHTEHFDRYPFGRESTVSYPAPNFTIQNNTPYGVLMWPTYTDSSITMHLYSTAWASGEQTGQTTSNRGSCTDVVTTRTISYVDGSPPTQDTFSGYYRNAGPTC